MNAITAFASSRLVSLMLILINFILTNINLNSIFIREAKTAKRGRFDKIKQVGVLVTSASSLFIFLCFCLYAKSENHIFTLIPVAFATVTAILDLHWTLKEKCR